MICPICKTDNYEQVLNYEEYPFFIKPVPEDFRDKVLLKPLNIVLCGTCGFVYQDVTFNDDELFDIYDSNYDSYFSPVLSGIGRSLATDFLDFLSGIIDFSGKKVLDIGCFDGFFLSLLKNKNTGTLKGCDPSSGAKIAHDIGIDVIKDYFSPELYPNETFDLIVLRSVLEHIKNPIEFLGKVKGNISANGLIALEVPNLKYSLENGVVGDFFHEHVNYFTRETLVICLSDAGYEPVSIDDNSYYIRGLFRIGNERIPQIHDTKTPTKEIFRLKKLFGDYKENNQRFVKGILNVKDKLRDKDVYIFGGGGHTVGFLSKTNKILKTKGVIDNDPTKKGKYIPGFNLPIYPKNILDQIPLNHSVVIISSKIFQDEIFQILEPYITQGLHIIRLYPKVEYIPNNN